MKTIDPKLPVLTINTKDIEVEKPSGGGHGPDALYSIEVLIDGQVALHLTRFNFKQNGQMAKFAEALPQHSSR